MPRDRGNLTIETPLGGVVKRTGFQTQPPFSLYSATNMRPYDPDTGRAVMSCRPELSSPSGPGTPVNLLCPVNGFRSGYGVQSMVAAVSGQIYWWDGTVWQLATGAQAAAADTGRAVYGTPFLQQAFIFTADSKPIVFDYTTGTAVTLVEFAGECPTDCRFGATWQGALWMAGSEEQPHVLYGSRTGQAFDWDFSADLEDEGGAYSNAGDDAGLLNGPITAIFNHTDDTLIVSTVEGIMALRGHPRRNGVFEQVSGATYILGQGAWCKAPGDVAYMMTPLGLAKLDPTPGAIVTQISREYIPDELVGLDYTISDPTISMAYCSRWNDIIITDRKSGSEQAWIYNLDTGRFWKDVYSNYPYVLFEFKPFVTSNKSGVLFGRSA